MFKEDEYLRLRAFLVIDQANLGEELMQLPQLLLEAIELTTQAYSVRDGVEMQYRVEHNLEAARLKEGGAKPPPETEVLRGAILSPNVLEVHDDLIAARGDLMNWQGLVEGLRAKLSAMKRLSDLTNSGYMATGSAYARGPSTAVANDLYTKGREEMAEARASAPALKRRQIPANG